MSELTGLGGAVLFILIVLGILITILWIILPFAVFGIKNRLDSIILLLKEQNKSVGSGELDKASLTYETVRENTEEKPELSEEKDLIGDCRYCKHYEPTYVTCTLLHKKVDKAVDRANPCGGEHFIPFEQN